MIRTFTLTAICCKLLALYTSQLCWQQASKQYFDACQRIFTHHHENGNTVTLRYDGHLLQKARWLPRSGSAFWRMTLLKNASCWSRLWWNTNAVYFYHSIINANLHLCYAVFSYILMQKECHFHLKNDILKHADSASKWQESRFRGLEISKP